MEKKWEEITDMQKARGGAFGVASQEKIFVAGGADEESTALKHMRCTTSPLINGS